jgi:hypothetical protein
MAVADGLVASAEGRSFPARLPSFRLRLRTTGEAPRNLWQKGLVSATNVPDFQKMKDQGRKVSMVTC